MATIAEIHTKVAEAVTAQEAGDFATAIAKLRSAKALLSVMPSSSSKEGAEVQFNAESLDSLIADLTRARAAAGGVRNTLVEFTNSPPDDE